jgi:hypothetical protein
MLAPEVEIEPVSSVSALVMMRVILPPQRGHGPM